MTNCKRVSLEQYLVRRMYQIEINKLIDSRLPIAIHIKIARKVIQLDYKIKSIEEEVLLKLKLSINKKRKEDWVEAQAWKTFQTMICKLWESQVGYHNPKHILKKRY